MYHQDLLVNVVSEQVHVLLTVCQKLAASRASDNDLAAKLFITTTINFTVSNFYILISALNFTHTKTYFMVNTKIIELFYLENVALTFQRFSAFFSN